MFHFVLPMVHSGLPVARFGVPMLRNALPKGHFALPKVVMRFFIAQNVLPVAAMCERDAMIAHPNFVIGAIRRL